ncbi:MULTISPECIES: NirD/YgiW/YdeI family stress tolerance protein [Paracoccaceae]|uniref:NirD/YgiW/YdeI family stress tolerance protein n=1 Tax=Paracoccaceae TaxID=31989 RepID=UPI001ABBC52B|nr:MULTISPECIES: NirD/YgiW/YdeI family stress tolerance protein [Paracoccaceae]
MKLFARTALLAALATTPALANQVTAIADAQRGTMVTVQGTVERITDEDEFRLADATGSIRIYVGPNWVPADVGEKITVNGFVDDDLGPREIYARTLTRADGTEITLDRRYE